MTQTNEIPQTKVYLSSKEMNEQIKHRAFYRNLANNVEDLDAHKAACLKSGFETYAETLERICAIIDNGFIMVPDMDRINIEY